MKSFAAVLCLLAAASAGVSAQVSPERGQRPVERAIFMNTPMPTGYLGIEMEDVTKENFSRLGLGEVRGVAVSRVVENSPASSAGIQKGDIIVKFDGETVSSTRKLQRLVGEVAPDHKASVSVMRGGSEIALTVTIGRREAPMVLEGGFPGGGDPQTFEFRVPRIEGLPPFGDGEGRRGTVIQLGERRTIGVMVTPLTKQLADHFGVTEGQGLLVNEVSDNSPAAKAGLKAGDVVVKADGKAIADNSGLVEAFNARKEGEVSLTVIRNRKMETIKVTPEISKDGPAGRGGQEIIIEGPVRDGRMMRRMLQGPFGPGATVRIPAPVL